MKREFFLLRGREALLEVAKDTHDVVTSLDTWSRRRINQSMLAAIGRRQWLFPPEHPETLPMTRAPVYRLSPDLDGLRLRIVRNRGGQGVMRN
ncbi:hypothetical protein [Pseudomonas poae]|uniref:hypothetical protein n=1 Tax=Pseudomonas poae TaxID=200451 RepID=UPI0030CD0DB0